MNLEIANRLLAYRRAHGLSQEELAEKLGVSRQAVSKWERAEAAPDTDNLIALAALYGVLIDELINGKDEPKAAQTQESTQDTTAEAESEAESANESNADTGHRCDDIGINIEDGGDKVHIGLRGIHIVDKDGDEVHIDGRGVIIKDGDDDDDDDDDDDVDCLIDDTVTTLQAELENGVIVEAYCEECGEDVDINEFSTLDKCPNCDRVVVGRSFVQA